jgi:CBS-domain-containing membrane protein
VELLDFKAEKLHEILNRFIENGVTFDVSVDDFQTIDHAQALKTSDREFLELNSAQNLCNLQQSLLMKHLFNHSPEQFEDFAVEITEREAINSEECLNTQVTKGDKTRFEIYLEAVKSTTRKWFAELLEKKRHITQAFDNKNASEDA